MVLSFVAFMYIGNALAVPTYIDLCSTTWPIGVRHDCPNWCATLPQLGSGCRRLVSCYRIYRVGMKGALSMGMNNDRPTIVLAIDNEDRWDISRMQGSPPEREPRSDWTTVWSTGIEALSRAAVLSASEVLEWLHDRPRRSGPYRDHKMASAGAWVTWFERMPPALRELMEKI